MSDYPYFVPRYIRTTGPLAITPVLGAFRVSGDTPPLAEPRAVEEPPEGQLPLTFWVDGRAVASHWFGAGAHKRVRESPLFAEPVSLALAFVFPRTAPGWMRVDVTAVGDSYEQVGALLDLFGDREHGLPLVHVGRGRIALTLGHHWIPVPAGVAAIVETGTEAALDVVERFGRDVENRIVYGEDHEIAVRLLNSIPGIRGEVVEA
jgi:hypothetical protein